MKPERNTANKQQSLSGIEIAAVAPIKKHRNSLAMTSKLKGSALILTVVLTSILAIVGVMFVMSSRIEKLSTSSHTDERELNNAVDTIIAKLSEELVLDTPGVAGQEYYDYAGGYEDTNNNTVVVDKWLASIEPYDEDGDPGTTDDLYWAQISDLTGYIARQYNPNNKRWGDWINAPKNGQIDVKVDADGYLDNSNNKVDYYTGRIFMPEYSEIALNENGQLYEQWADADGDGVADSKWIELDDSSTGKGQKIYAAIRVIDNGAMLNLNTAYLFDPNNTDPNDSDEIDGSSLMQVNLAHLSLRDTSDTIQNHAENLQGKRDTLFDGTKEKLNSYDRDVCWRYGEPDDPNGQYRPFDISDELQLRYRCILDQADTYTRIENIWDQTFKEGKSTPYTGKLEDWAKALNYFPPDVNEDYSYKNLVTVYNTDRIIDPNGNVLINVNPDPNELNDPNIARSNPYSQTKSYDFAKELYAKLLNIIDSNNISRTNRVLMKRDLAQWAVNLVDIRDRDIDVTSINLNEDRFDKEEDFDSNDYVFGIEPFPVITQVAMRIDPNDPNSNPNLYAVELFNPFDQDIEFDNTYPYQLVITDVNEIFDPNDPNTFINVIAEFDLGAGGLSLLSDDYIVFQNFSAAFDVNTFVDPNFILDEPNLIFSSGYRVTDDPISAAPIVDSNIVNSHNLAIRRYVDVEDSLPRYIYLDRQIIYKDWVRHSKDPNLITRSYARNFDLELSKWWDVVYRDPNLTKVDVSVEVLGETSFSSVSLIPRPAIDISVPYSSSRDLVTVGDIDRIWTIGPTEFLIDPPDANSPGESILFDPNSIDAVDPIDPNDFNDPNFIFESRLTNFNEFDRTIGEKLAFVSISIDRFTANINDVNISGRASDEDLIRLNLGDPLYTNIFQYLTVFDPRVDGIDNDDDNIGIGDQVDSKEIKVPGRININTAPAYVLARLPWMNQNIADAVVAYRDKRNLTGGPNYTDRDKALDVSSKELDWYESLYDVGDNFWLKSGFASIGELTLIVDKDSHSIRKYSLEPGPYYSQHYPDLTYIDYYSLGEDDGANNDFEERNLIFSRISNLVTVRSDVFTAYILVRLGTDGPQKRAIAILDRSDVRNKNDKVKVIALQMVPDPR